MMPQSDAEMYNNQDIPLTVLHALSLDVDISALADPPF